MDSETLEKETLLTNMLMKEKGLNTIASAMANPLRRSLDYKGMARTILKVRKLYKHIIGKSLLESKKKIDLLVPISNRKNKVLCKHYKKHYGQGTISGWIQEKNLKVISRYKLRKYYHITTEKP